MVELQKKSFTAVDVTVNEKPSVFRRITMIKCYVMPLNNSRSQLTAEPQNYSNFLYVYILSSSINKVW